MARGQAVARPVSAATDDHHLVSLRFGSPARGRSRTVSTNSFKSAAPQKKFSKNSLGGVCRGDPAQQGPTGPIEPHLGRHPGDEPPLPQRQPAGGERPLDVMALTCSSQFVGESSHQADEPGLGLGHGFDALPRGSVP